jgi:hypothetical protein
VKKDPHASEPKVELDKVTYLEWLTAASNADAWKKEADRLAKMLQDQIGDAYAGTVDGQKVLGHRPQERYRVKDLVAENPNLTQHYMKFEMVETLDVVAFGEAHPDILQKYQSRSFRRLGELE